MLYLFLDQNSVKVLFLKKSLLGQYETKFFNKTYPGSPLLEKGKVVNIDFVASAVKESLQSLSEGELKEKETVLILPQEAYKFLRFRIPSDIALTAIEAFLLDKVKTHLPLNLDDYTYDWLIEEGNQEKYVHFFAIETEILSKFREALNLIELRIQKVLPESVAYFKLFQKTLRKDKKENILFVVYSKNNLMGFLYDSYGQLSSEKWLADLGEQIKIEKLLQEKAEEYEQKGFKLNRLILAGEESDKVRQDTFTKEIGVWTNPLKRIIPEFYQDYLKNLINSSRKPFSVLSYEVCLGSFILADQNKKFSLLNNSKGRMKKLLSFPKINIFNKEFLIFLASFLFSFVLLLLLSKNGLKFNFALPSAKPTTIHEVSPSPKPEKPSLTPTPELNKTEIKIKILNGVGTAGLAAEVKEVLKEKGYQEILTDNADSFDYEQTELQVKKSKSSIFEVLKADLKANVSEVKESVLNEDETADVIVIVGSDFN